MEILGGKAYKDKAEVNTEVLFQCGLVQGITQKLKQSIKLGSIKLELHPSITEHMLYASKSRLQHRPVVNPDPANNMMDTLQKPGFCWVPRWTHLHTLGR